MSASTIDTIETILSNLLADSDDAEVNFKLRTALSLLVVIREREDIVKEALVDADIDESLRSDLVELGYFGLTERH